MKEYLHQILRTAPSPVQGRNEVREYLQARVLGILQRAGMMIPLAFHGCGISVIRTGPRRIWSCSTTRWNRRAGRAYA